MCVSFQVPRARNTASYCSSSSLTVDPSPIGELEVERHAKTANELDFLVQCVLRQTIRRNGEAQHAPASLWASKSSTLCPIMAR